MRTEQLEFRTSNRILKTYKNFPYKPWYAIAELVDNSTQSYRWHKERLEEAYRDEGKTLEVRISYDRKNGTLSVWDNAMGMSWDELQHGILLANPPEDTSGRSEFGMGMKTACSWLGRVWTVETKKLDETERYRVSVDIDSFGPADEALEAEIWEGEDPEKHFTVIEVNEMFHEFRGRRLGKIKDYLVSMYREDIRSGNLRLFWDGDELEPKTIVPLTITDGAEERTWKKDLEFSINGKRVTGYACLLAKENRGRKYAGFDLLRRGRVIVGRPGGYRPEVIFGEARNDLKNQRLYGELHLDEFPVNHLKDDFIWESFQQKFDEALADHCSDLIGYLKDFRAADETVTPEAQEAADNAVVDELTNEDMVRRLEFLTAANPPEPMPEDARAAEAEILRKESSSRRETTAGRFTIRVFHSKDAPPERQYMKFLTVDGETIDVFLNDNHPFLHRDILGDPERYETYIKMCIYDALAEWIARRIPDLNPETITHFKDQLMRGPGFESVRA